MSSPFNRESVNLFVLQLNHSPLVKGNKTQCRKSIEIESMIGFELNITVDYIGIKQQIPRGISRGIIISRGRKLL